jgi:hypothetical protein
LFDPAQVGPEGFTKLISALQAYSGIARDFQFGDKKDFSPSLRV